MNNQKIKHVIKGIGALLCTVAMLVGFSIMLCSDSIVDINDMSIVLLIGLAIFLVGAIPVIVVRKNKHGEY